MNEWMEYRGRSNQFAGNGTGVLVGTALVNPTGDQVPVEVELLRAELVVLAAATSASDVVDCIRAEEAASGASLVNRTSSAALAQRTRGRPYPPASSPSRAWIVNCNPSDGGAQTTVPIAGDVERVASQFSDSMQTAVGWRYNAPKVFPIEGLALQVGLLCAVRLTAVHTSGNVFFVNWHWREREAPRRR